MMSMPVETILPCVSVCPLYIHGGITANINLCPLVDCFETHEKNKSRQDVTVRECKLVFEKCIADRSKVVVGTAA